MARETRSQALAAKRPISEVIVDDEDIKPIILPDGEAVDGDDSSDSGSSDDEDLDEDAEVVGACEYNERDEAFPNCVAYDRDFTQVGKDLISIPNEAVALIDTADCNSSRVQGCRTNAYAITDLPKAKRQKVALLGNTGAGKSSLLNSLLGLPNLAKAMASGESCTHVGTEYEPKFPGQTKYLAAQIEYFDIDAIRALLEHLLKDYDMWTFNQQSDWDEDEKLELKRLCTTAFKTFQALFCDRLEFNSVPAGDEYLQECHDTEDSALETMVGWCEELLEGKEADEEDHMEYLDADSQKELLEQLEPLVFGNSTFEEPCLWPLVKMVRVGIDGPRILEHVTLVDLPGLDDVNKVRVDASHDMVRSCDTIWVVTKIDRAITDTSVDTLLMRYGRSYRMVLVCTGVDANLDGNLAAHLADQKQSIGNHDELLQSERSSRKLAKKLAKKLDTKKAKLEGRSGRKRQKVLTEKAKDKLRADIKRLESEHKTAEKTLRESATSRFELLDNARNAYTTRRLKEDKKEHLTKGKMLDVFCVSNLHYAALKGFGVVSGPQLNPTDTGIPALRHFILQAAAPAQLQALENLIGHKLTVFLKGLGMWAKTFSVESSDELLESVKQPSSKLGPIFTSYVSDRVADTEKHAIYHLHDVQNKVVTEAVAELEKKRRWHWATARAFIRRDGNHKTSVAAQQCWNEQLLVGATKVVEDQWDEYLAEQEKRLGELQEELEGLITRIGETVASHPASMVLPMDRIDELLAAQVESIEHACRDFQEEEEKELRNIKLDLTQDRHTGYFSQTMDEVYEACKSDSGKGVKDRSIAKFEAHLRLNGKRSPFAVMADKLSQSITKGTKTRAKPVSQKIEDILTQIARQFDDLVDENTEDPEEEQLRKQFRAFLETAEVKFDDIKTDLARIKRRYP